MSQKRWFKSRYVECGCGSNHIFLKISMQDFERDADEEEVADLTERSWIVEIVPVIETLRDKLKIAWCILRGRDICLREISIDAVDLKEMRNLADSWLREYSGFIDNKQKTFSKGVAN